MKKFLHSLLFFFTVNFSIAQTNSCTVFPTSSEGTDYNVRGFTVQMAFPAVNGKGRLLIKGGNNFAWFKVNDSTANELIAAQQLLAPNYTTVIEVPTGQTEITFSQDGKIFKKENILNTHVISSESLYDADTSFSILLYGCFEPFEINKKTGDAMLNMGKHNSNYFMRNLFSKVALEKPLHYYQQYRNNDSGKYEFIKQEQSLFQPSLKNVKAIIGTGDQVYVDAGYKNQGKKTAISTWQIKEKPMPLVDTNCYANHLNNMYLHFASFDKLQETFLQKPSFSMWDDHEIRDGWGSHGDEYSNGQLNQPLKTYYLQSRKAFIEHQWIKGPASFLPVSELVIQNKSLHQSFILGGKHCFVFDLRSERDITRKQALSNEQLEAFKNWLMERNVGEEILLVSSIPLFVTYRKIINITGKLDAELKDDVYDGWDSEYNIMQRDSIVAYLLKARIEKDIKPYIVSGDIHTGGIAEIWYDDESNNQLCFAERKKDRRVLAYEIIASGLNHETLNQGGLMEEVNRKVKRAMKDLRVNDAMIEHINLNGKNYSIDNFFRAYESKLNFGSIQFTSSQTMLHTFLFNYDRNDHVEQLTITAEWNKTEAEDRKHYKIKNNNCDKFNYQPPLPQERKKIYVRKNW